MQCIHGEMLDVIVDVRPSSGTYLQHCSVRLSGEDSLTLYVPSGFAHGFQTLADETDVLYQMTDYYAPDLAGGFRWNDPAFGIEWPIADPIMNERDRLYPDFNVKAVKVFDDV